MSDIREVWKYCPLKDGCCSISQKFYRAAICGEWTKKLQTFSRHFFWEGPSKYCIAKFAAILVCLLLSWSGDIQWNEVATSTVRNFNNSWPLYLIFLNMINLCPNIWFIKNSKCQQFAFWKRSHHKHKVLIFLKSCYFVMGGPIDMKFGVF